MIMADTVSKPLWLRKWKNVIQSTWRKTSSMITADTVSKPVWLQKRMYVNAQSVVDIPLTLAAQWTSMIEGPFRFLLNTMSKIFHITENRRGTPHYDHEQGIQLNTWKLKILNENKQSGQKKQPQKKGQWLIIKKKSPFFPSDQLV